MHKVCCPAFFFFFFIVLGDLFLLLLCSSYGKNMKKKSDLMVRKHRPPAFQSRVFGVKYITQAILVNSALLFSVVLPSSSSLPLFMLDSIHTYYLQPCLTQKNCPTEWQVSSWVASFTFPFVTSTW